MRDLLTDLVVNTDKFYQGNMEYFEDWSQEEDEDLETDEEFIYRTCPMKTEGE